MSARAILEEAYRCGLVPHHLFGKTQHNTLQARLSEDIVLKRDGSAFFRTAPGRFFLTELLRDNTIPEEYRRPIVARRRSRDLIKGPVLAVQTAALRDLTGPMGLIDPRSVFSLLGDYEGSYADPRQKGVGKTFIRSFVCVRRSFEILTYRIGRYRDDRDNFMARRAIGFSTLVSVGERTLFSKDDFGIVEAGIHAAAVDLDIPSIESAGHSKPVDARLQHFLLTPDFDRSEDLLAVITLTCPEWFDPVRRRLALNDLQWLDIRTNPNNISDFDPWSRAVLGARYLVPPPSIGAHRV